MKKYYYRICKKTKAKFFIPLYGEKLWNESGLLPLLFNDDFHFLMKFYHNFFIPIIWFFGCACLGRYLGIYFYNW